MMPAITGTLPLEAQGDVASALDGEAGRLFGIAVTILPDDGKAEDAVQEVLSRAWTRRRTLRDPLARRAWLTRICVNYCVSRRRRLPLPVGETPVPPPAGWRLDARQLDLDRAYATLSVRQRAALVRFYGHGYSIQECGELMSCARGTVRSHLARALRALRKEMNDA
jgi:RNA polymerase sigma-70 factor (ECF subfamily)